ncbi:MAG: hypothetical protein Q9190_004699 [Brigantiaea leucoxantha]
MANLLLVNHQVRNEVIEVLCEKCYFPVQVTKNTISFFQPRKYSELGVLWYIPPFAPRVRNIILEIELEFSGESEVYWNIQVIHLMKALELVTYELYMKCELMREIVEAFDTVQRNFSQDRALSLYFLINLEEPFFALREQVLALSSLERPQLPAYLTRSIQLLRILLTEAWLWRDDLITRSVFLDHNIWSDTRHVKLLDMARAVLEKVLHTAEGMSVNFEEDLPLLSLIGEYWKESEDRLDWDLERTRRLAKVDRLEEKTVGFH